MLVAAQSDAPSGDDDPSGSLVAQLEQQLASAREERAQCALSAERATEKLQGAILAVAIKIRKQVVCETCEPTAVASRMRAQSHSGPSVGCPWGVRLVDAGGARAAAEAHLRASKLEHEAERVRANDDAKRQQQRAADLAAQVPLQYPVVPLQ